MKIIFIHGYMFNIQSWLKAGEELKREGVDIHLFSQMQSGEKAVKMLEEGDADIVIAQLFNDLPWKSELLEATENTKMRMGLGWDMPESFSTFSKDQVVTFNRYLEHISSENYTNAIRFLVNCVGEGMSYDPPEPVRTHGIYHPDAETLFDDTLNYFKWYRNRKSAVTGSDTDFIHYLNVLKNDLENRSDALEGKNEGGNDIIPPVPNPGGPVVAILCYYGQIVEKNCDDIDAMIRFLDVHGMVPLCIASEGAQDTVLDLPERYPWLQYIRTAVQRDEQKDLGDSFGRADGEGEGVDGNSHHFQSLSAVVNMMAGRLLSTSGDTHLFQALGVPVFQAVRLYNQTPEEWALDSDSDKGGSGSFGMVYGLAQPELSGAIEPTMAAGSTPERHEGLDLSSRRYTPVMERIDHLCARIRRWITLQQLPNAQKQVTIVLNNNPCKGVESTLGLAVGLDTFESLAKVISAMKAQGYDVGDAPEEGRVLLQMFHDRKAFSEFRWTTVDEIVKKGGALCMVGADEYLPWFNALPEQARDRVLQDWDDFPGEGMVYNNELVITGLAFGNLKIMIQPKRGCYGAKCNGEVCRILHDPELSPPHHWLATYRFIQQTSDVVLHFGTMGALEFLPGKPAMLSQNCFPEISLGDLPNVYLYIMDVPAEGVIAKRRGRAVMVDHLTPVYGEAVLDDDTLTLERLLGEYQTAKTTQVQGGGSGRVGILKDQMVPLMKRLNLLDDAFEAEDFEVEAKLASRKIARMKRTLTPKGLHTLGLPPDDEGIETMLSTIAKGQSDRLSPSDKGLAPEQKTADKVKKALLNTDREIPQLLKALDGGYIEPGLCGSLSLGKTDAIPTGRNFFITDVQALPTQAAWKVGQMLADNLIAKYLREEEKFPASVGLSLWSIDAFKSDGEVFCQILHLMGMRPVWDASNRVSKIEAVPLNELSITVNDDDGTDGTSTTHSPRPRIDVVMQTSGILRDMVPHFADLVDEAAVLAASLDEPHELNFIKKHTDEEMAELKEELGASLSESEMMRMATFRVFSSAPGTYGVGVGLAIDASAWEDEKDLAETYINWGGYAYGSSRAGNSGVSGDSNVGTDDRDGDENASGSQGRFSRVNGREAHNLYAKNLKKIDVAYMRQYSPDYDLVDSGCYAGYLGGMSLGAGAVGDKNPRLYWADVNTEGDLSVRDLKEDIEVAVQVKLFSPSWIDHQKNHGYKGAAGVASRVNNLFKWSATTKKVEKWVFDKVVETYIDDKENLAWLQSENPYALEEMTRRLLEAESRGLWEADPEMLESVRHAALQVEGDMEEIMGEVSEEFQGSRVDVMTTDAVEKWQPKWSI